MPPSALFRTWTNYGLLYCKTAFLAQRRVVWGTVKAEGKGSLSWTVFAQLSLPLHAHLSAGSTKPFGIIQALLRYPGGISDTSISQLLVPKSLGGTLWREYLDCWFVSVWEFFRACCVLGTFWIENWFSLVCVEGEGEILPKPLNTALCGPW